MNMSHPRRIGLIIVIAILVVLLVVSNVVTYYLAGGGVTKTVTQTVMQTVRETVTTTQLATVTQTIATTFTITQTVPGTPSPSPSPTPTPLPSPSPSPSPSPTIAPQLEVPSLPTPDELAKMFPSPVTISLWDGLTGGDGYVMDELIQRFHNYTRGIIKIERTVIGWADLFARLIAIYRSGDIESLPDFILIHPTEIPLLRPLLAPVDELAKNAGLKKEMFAPMAWNNCVWDGTLLCLPWDTHPYLLYFRLDIAQKYNIRIPPPACETYGLPCWDRPLETLDDFRDWILNEVKPKLPSEIVATGLEPGTAGGTQWAVWGFIKSNPFVGSGTIEDPKPNFDKDPEFLKALELLYEFQQKGVLKKFVWSDLANCLAQGQTFTWIHGPWMLATFDKINCTYGAIPILKGHTWANQHIWVLTIRGAKHPEALKALAIFFRFMYQPENIGYWGIRAGHVAATWAAIQVYVEGARKMLGDLAAKAREMWAYQVFQWGFRLMPLHPLIVQVNDIMGTYLDQVMSGAMTPQDAASAIQHEVEGILEAWKAQTGK